MKLLAFLAMVYGGWTIDPAEVLSLPLDELGLRILNDLAEEQTAMRSGLNERNWFLALNQSPAYRGRADALAACSEAWGWLRVKVLIARNPDQDYASGSVVITRRGRQVLERGLDYLRAVERLDIDMHRVLEQKARPEFLRGDFETAVFVAFKEVEVRVRERANLPENLIGVKLMREAFGQGRPLAVQGADAGEVVAEMELYAGALGLFKNPTSHRLVDYGSPTEAAEVVLLADLLLRLLDRR